jgi:hypothetical protein
MSPDIFALLRSNRPAQAALAAAALLALVGIAKVVTTHSTKPVITSKTLAAPAKAVPVPSATLPVLAPNETLVVPAGKPMAPLMPHYATPVPPPPAPAVPDQPQTPEAASAEAQAALVAPPPPMAPLPEPVATRPMPLPSPLPMPMAPPARAASYCPRCGEVISLTVWPNMAEVQVRFQDGSVHTLRSPVPSPWRVGDHVRAEQGNLVRD